MFYRIRSEANQNPTNMEEVLRILQDRSFFEQIERGQLDSAQRAEPGRFIREHNLECLF
jgi:acetolactate synthase regulatory subunit